MTIEPDTKDWTWVLRQRCPECGLDTQNFPRDEIGGMIRAKAAAWQRLLTSPDDPRLRPSPAKWSALEYGCHVRDVLRLHEQRLTLMLTQDGPRFPNWDQDTTAVADRYSEQDPAAVARDLATAADVIAAPFDNLAPANGSALAAAVTEPTSPSSPSRGTSSTTRSIISTTSPAPGTPPSRDTLRAAK